jgi:hypothetical protein
LFSFPGCSSEPECLLDAASLGLPFDGGDRISPEVIQVIDRSIISIFAKSVLEMKLAENSSPVTLSGFFRV